MPVSAIRSSRACGSPWAPITTADCRFEPDLTPQQYATEYGQVVVNHLNFDLGRINPYFTQNASVGLDLYEHEKRSVRFQGDIANLSNTLEVIDFGGLFSGNAIGPARQYTFRLVSTF